jgi:hypothetical protein
MGVCGLVVVFVFCFFIVDDLWVEWWVARSYMEFARAPVEDKKDER